MSARARRLLPLTIATAVGVAILVGLGSWQLARLNWKTDLVARVVAVHVRETAADTAVGSRLQSLASNLRNRAPWPRRSPAAIGASLPMMDMASAGPASEAATAGPWMPPGAIR